MTPEPSSYRGWMDLLRERGAIFGRYADLPHPTTGLRTLLRHDIDLLDPVLMERCRRLELELAVTSSWFFLPPRDRRYAGSSVDLARYIRSLQADGFEIGYHVNAWERPGTCELVDDPLARLDEDLAWFAETLGAPVRVAVAHGIPHHRDAASNLSMFDALAERGVAMLDIFVIRDGGKGRRVPHFGHRSRNPVLPTDLKITYTSDSGGPIRREWNDLGAALRPGNSFVLNTHCANYDIERRLTYRDADPSRRAIPTGG